ncbi:MAG: alpha/beta hydrolase [Pseudomonadota bacterium]
MPFVTLRDGQSIHVRLCGRGEPVLLLPALGMRSSCWLPFIWPFLHRFRFYMPDFRGSGPSSAAHLNQSDVFQNHMEDVQDVITHFGLQGFLLVGYSLGASVALHLQRAGGFAGVKRYLHMDISPCICNREDWPYGLFGERQQEFFTILHRLNDVLAKYAHFDRLEYLPFSAHRQVASILTDMLSKIFAKPLPLLRPLLLALSCWPWLFSRLVPITRISDIQAYLFSYLQACHDYRESLRRCQTPVTLMIGMRSAPYDPAGQMKMADYAKNSTLVLFEKAGHMLLVESPIKFTRELGRFLHGR